MSKNIIFFFSLLFLTSNSHSQSSQSQFVDMLDGRFDVSAYLSENTYGFLPVPIIITDPAVDGGLGVMGLIFHETETEKEQRLKTMQNAERNADRYLLPPSVSAIMGLGTGNDSYALGGGHMGFFDKGRIRYKGGGGYGNINLDYYGSADVSLSQPIELKTKASMVFQSLQMKVADSSFFAGLTQRYVNANISPNSFGDFDALLPPDFANELKGLLTLDVTTSGLGFNFEFDTRDNIFTPTQGYQYSLTNVWYRDAIGSDIEYELISLQGLNYLTLTDHWRLGFKIESEYARSDDLLPPFATPSINLRGIPAMRYQGKLIGALETEITWLMDSRWSLVGFLGTGRASNDLKDFNEAPSNVTQGIGFRYQIARRYGFDMGIDIAQGPEDTIWYITAGSAWGR